MFGDANLLEAWESAQYLAPSDRALKFLSFASPASEANAVEELTIGERDLRLMRFRKGLFGSKLEVQMPCGACGQNMEATLDLDSFAAPLEPPDKDDRLVNIKGRSLRIRAPKVKDVKEISGAADRSSIVKGLLASCVRTANGTALDPELLDAEEISQIGDCMAQLDSSADIVVALTCPHCGATAQWSFDIAHVLFREFDHFARQLLGDIHLIAAAYGWPESEILSISAARRRAYLDLIAS
jgi:hypothetical protein